MLIGQPRPQEASARMNATGCHGTTQQVHAMPRATALLKLAECVHCMDGMLELHATLTGEGSVQLSGYVTMVQQRLLTSTGLCFSVSCSRVDFLLAVLGNNPDSTIIQQLLDCCSR